MHKGKMIIIPAIALATIWGTGIATPKAEAFGGGNGQSFLQRLAEKFHLNQDDVKKFAQENQAERRLRMQSNFEARLDQAVKDGKITEEQKKLILEKHQEMQNEREQNREEHQNLSREEKQKERQNRYEEIKNWADQNGIDMKYMFGQGRGTGYGTGCPNK
jgi:hypothetical protein